MTKRLAAGPPVQPRARPRRSAAAGGAAAPARSVATGPPHARPRRAAKAKGSAAPARGALTPAWRPAVPAAPDVVQVRPPRTVLCRWSELPGEVRTLLAREGVASEARLGVLPPDALRRVLESAPRPFQELIIACWRGAACAAWRSQDRDVLAGHPALREVCSTMVSPRLEGAGTLSGVLGLALPPGRSGDVPPLTALTALRSAACGGSDPAEICRAVVRQRVTLSLRSSSAATYASHLRSVARFCSLVGQPAIPASASLILLYSTVCGCATTLRGHIAAWHYAHVLTGATWPDIPRDCWRAVYRGTTAIQAPRRPRPGARRRLVEALLCGAVAERKLRFAAACALAYVFLLRVPSELLAQFRFSNSKASRGWGAAVGVPPGPRLVRKNRPAGTSLSRACVCVEGAPPARLCPHLWLEYLRESRTGDLLLAGYTYSRFLADLRAALGKLASADTAFREIIGDPTAWGSHVFRTGAGRDILAAGGIAAAQEAGQWDSLAGLRAYTTSDGLDARGMAEALIDSSDEEAADGRRPRSTATKRVGRARG